MVLLHSVEIAGALTLGGFVGLDRRLAGAAAAIPCHAAAAMLGLVLGGAAGLAGSTEPAPGGVAPAILLLVCLIVAASAQTERDLWSVVKHHADALGLGSAVLVGAACATGEGRPVALAILASIAMAIFRPRTTLAAAVVIPPSRKPAGSACAVAIGQSPPSVATDVPDRPLEAFAEGDLEAWSPEPRPTARPPRPKARLQRDHRAVRGYAMRGHRFARLAAA